MIRIILTGALLVAVMTFASPAAQAYNEAPWCAVINLGPGDAHWDCQYPSLEACVPNVLAGNRGFCNPNPAYNGPMAAPRKHYARRRHHSRRD